jgi:hypothetical protein
MIASEAVRQAALPKRFSSRVTAVGRHVSPRGARMPRVCNSAAMPGTLVTPER